MKNILEEKICSKCNVSKSLGEFYSYPKIGKQKGEYVYYTPDCKECTKSRVTEWGKNNRDKKLSYQKKSNRLPKSIEDMKRNSRNWIESGRQLEWQRMNKNKIYSYVLKRKETKEHNISQDEWENCKEYFNYSCSYCGVSISNHLEWYGQDFHKEHADPNGSNDLSNCIPSCKSCNSQKHIKSFEEWYTLGNPNFDQNRYDRITQWLSKDYIKFLN